MTLFSKLGAEIWRDYSTDGVPASGAHRIVKSDMRAWMASVENFASGKIFIAATGQSNVANHKTNAAWAASPPSNLKVWGFEGTDGYVPPSTWYTPAQMYPGEVKWAWAFGARIARMFPNHEVYVCDVGIGSQPIAQWKTSPTIGGGLYDMYANADNNFTAAVAAAGVATIDVFLWWQGESDVAALTNYVTDFEAVINRFKAETYFPENTPILISGISSQALTGNANYRKGNMYLQTCAGVDPDHRLYCYPGVYASTHWESAANIHMLGTGYQLYGEACADAWLGRHRRPVFRGVVQDLENGPIGLGTSNPTAFFDANGGIRSTGSSTASAGVGIELDYSGGVGRVFAYNRDTAAFVNVQINTVLTVNGTSGYVGINRASPTQALDVVGSIIVKSTILVLGTDESYRAGLNITSNNGYLALRNSSATQTVNIDSNGTTYFNGGNAAFGGTTASAARVVVNGAIAITDGMAAPSTAAGFGIIYIDTADGDLKIKFGDGTVKTIVIDT